MTLLVMAFVAFFFFRVGLLVGRQPDLQPRLREYLKAGIRELPLVVFAYIPMLAWFPKSLMLTGELSDVIGWFAVPLGTLLYIVPSTAWGLGVVFLINWWR